MWAFLRDTRCLKGHIENFCQLAFVWLLMTIKAERCRNTAKLNAYATILTITQWNSLTCYRSASFFMLNSHLHFL